MIKCLFDECILEIENILRLLFNTMDETSLHQSCIKQVEDEKVSTYERKRERKKVTKKESNKERKIERKKVRK